MYDQDEEGLESYQGNLILLGNIKGRFEYPELRRMTQMLYQEHRPDVCMVEKKASGQSLIQDLRLAGLPIQEYQPDRDKVSRAYAVSSLFHNSRIYAPLSKVWSKEVIEECRQFPSGPHDDIVDSVTQAVLYVRNGGYLEHSDNSWLDLGDESIYNRKRRRFY